MSQSLVIVGCSQRKKCTLHIVPAIERYDGPIFRVFRKHIRETADAPVSACILSGRFGLISGCLPIPQYDQRLTHTDFDFLRTRVVKQLKQELDSKQPDRVFVSVGSRYWPLLEAPLAREVPSDKLFIAKGSIGGRASQLAHWLSPVANHRQEAMQEAACGEAVLLGTTVRLSHAEILKKALSAMSVEPAAARRYETWYVLIGQQRVAPKWLVSILFNIPVARFRTADARRVLSQLGVSCCYASQD